MASGTARQQGCAGCAFLLVLAVVLLLFGGMALGFLLRVADSIRGL